MIGELIREKVLKLTKEEVPHSVTCLVENIDFSKKSVYFPSNLILYIVRNCNVRGESCA